MNFGTLISQVGSLTAPVKALPTFETQTLYWHFPTMMFVNDPILLVPLLPDQNKFIGYGTVDIISKWNQTDQDTKNITIKLDWYDDNGDPNYEYDFDLEIFVKRTESIPAKTFGIEILPMGLSEGEPTTPILIVTLYIQRTVGLYEVV